MRHNVSKNATVDAECYRSLYIKAVNSVNIDIFKFRGAYLYIIEGYYHNQYNKKI